MKAAFNITALAVLLVAPSPCFALWLIAPVSRAEAKERGMEVRTTATGPSHVIVELEFKTEGNFEAFSPEGKFKERSRVELRIGEGANPSLTATLREDRSKQGRVVVSFTADRAQLDKLKLWVYVPESAGGTIYDLRVNDFVEPKKDR